jgi:hypothetical protein
MKSDRLFSLSLVLTLFMVCSGTLADSAYVLVSVDDFARSLAAEGVDELVERGADPLGPDIGVLRPGDGDEFMAPIDIHITFEPTVGAKIDLSTLKITYGFLGVDVTDRVTENAEVNEQGILSEGAMLPAGKHKLTVFVSDNLGRMGKRRFSFRITE